MNACEMTELIKSFVQAKNRLDLALLETEKSRNALGSIEQSLMISLGSGDFVRFYVEIDGEVYLVTRDYNNCGGLSVEVEAVFEMDLALEDVLS